MAQKGISPRAQLFSSATCRLQDYLRRMGPFTYRALIQFTRAWSEWSFPSAQVSSTLVFPFVFPSSAWAPHFVFCVLIAPLKVNFPSREFLPVLHFVVLLSSAWTLQLLQSSLHYFIIAVFRRFQISLYFTTSQTVFNRMRASWLVYYHNRLIFFNVWVLFPVL